MIDRKRNLIFHVYPRADGQKWRRSVAHLLERWSVFTGRRIVTVAIDETTDSADEVREAFGNCEAEFRVLKNSTLQESGGFIQMLQQVESVNDPDEITLYCHAKGATHPSDSAASHVWADAMFSACLDFPGLIDCALSRADVHVCGAFRSTQPFGIQRTPPFHFAGTFFWFRNAELFRRRWRSLDGVFFGVEAYPGQQFAMAESSCLFFDNAQTGHLYSPEFWKQTILPAFRLWQANMRACGLTPIAADPPVCELLRDDGQSAAASTMGARIEKMASSVGIGQ